MVFDNITFSPRQDGYETVIEAYAKGETETLQECYEQAVTYTDQHFDSLIEKEQQIEERYAESSYLDEQDVEFPVMRASQMQLLKDMVDRGPMEVLETIGYTEAFSDIDWTPEHQT